MEAAIQGKKQNEPFILIIGTIEDPKQVFLVVDSILVTEIHYKDILLALICSFLCLTSATPKAVKPLIFFLNTLCSI